ncbi:MAG: response regulator [Cyanobacteria bacterium P01_D01_bin.44]
MKFLLVEDDEKLAGALQQVLTEQSYLVDLATDGDMAEAMAEAFPYDLILLDWMLPKQEGIQVCRQLRATGNPTPIILVTSRDASTDKVAGLDAGADDYLVKPFEVEELLARIRALLRRAEGIVSPVLQWGDLCLDPSSAKVTYCSMLISLTPKEYGLLELFLRNPHRVFSLNDLLDKLWSFDESPYKGAVRTHVKALRQKLKQVGLTDVIDTVYGLGYRLTSAEPSAQPSEKASQTEIAPKIAPPAKPSQLDLAALWQPVRETYLQRVANLAKTLHNLPSGMLNQAVQQQMITEAHALAGSLGSFGFPAVTTQCQTIERILLKNACLDPQHVRQLGALITQVLQTLMQTDLVSVSLPGSANLPLGQPSKLLMVRHQDDGWTQTLTAAAAERGMQVTAVDEVAQARLEIAQQRPDVVLLEVSSASELANSDEFQLLAELQERHPPMPVLVLTAETSFENRVRVARWGAAGLLQKPVPPAEVLETIAQVLQKGAPSAARLLIVDDDLNMLNLVQSLLQPWGFRLQLLSEPQRFWETLEQVVPDLVMLDVEMAQLSGFDLCQVLRNAPQWQEIPVLFMSAHTDAETIQRVFAVGGDDYIRKPVVAPELVARVLSWVERTRTRHLAHR